MTSNGGIKRLSAPWPVYKMPVGTVHQGAKNDTFYVLVGWSWL